MRHAVGMRYTTYAIVGAHVPHGVRKRIRQGPALRLSPWARL